MKLKGFNNFYLADKLQAMQTLGEPQTCRMPTSREPSPAFQLEAAKVAAQQTRRDPRT